MKSPSFWTGVRQMNEDVKVNDGGGLLDNIGLIDTLIVNCNDLPKAMAAGEYVKFCGMIVEMVQKLAQLKIGIRNDMKSLQNRIDEMKKAAEVRADG